MSRIPRTGRQLTMSARRGKRCWQSAPPTASASQTADSTSADKYPVVGPLSFRRIVDIPYQICVAALGSWQAEQHGELLVGQSMLSRPFKRDRDSGTCRIEVRLARGPLRPRLRMRLDIDRWSATSTVLELIPCRRVRPTAAYFRAGHRLLDALTHSLPQCAPPPRLGSATASQPPAPHNEPGAGVPGGAAARSVVRRREMSRATCGPATDRGEPEGRSSHRADDRPARHRLPRLQPRPGRIARST